MERQQLWYDPKQVYLVVALHRTLELLASSYENCRLVAKPD